MLCSYCQTHQVAPSELDAAGLGKSVVHKHVKLKNNKSIHVLHVNERPQSAAQTTIIEPPTRVLSQDGGAAAIVCELSEPTQPSSPELPTNTVTNTTAVLSGSSHSKYQQQPQEAATSNSNNSNNVVNLNDFASLTQLVDSSILTKSKKHGLSYLNGANVSFFYRNKLKLGESQNPYPVITEDPNRSLPILFFVHGVGGSARIWYKQLAYFGALGFEAIALDLVGHGESTEPKSKESYEFLEMAGDALLVFDSYVNNNKNAENNCIVIGHSYGCSFATYLAQSRPNIVSRLVLISGGSPYPLDYKSPILSLPLCLIQGVKPLINCHFFCSAFSSYFSRPENATDAFKISAKTLFYTMKGQIWRAANEDFHRSLKQPVLLIEGDDDKFVPIEDAIDMVKILKYSYLAVIKNGSHMLILEKSDIVNRIIYLFLIDKFS